VGAGRPAHRTRRCRPDVLPRPHPRHPRDPGTWPVADARPVPDYIQDALALGQILSTLGKAAFNGIRAYAEQNNIKIDGLPADPDAEIPQTRPCTSSTTSWPSSSRCCTRPHRVRPPRAPEPDAGEEHN
jgi:hypothetical protein